MGKATKITYYHKHTNIPRALHALDAFMRAGECLLIELYKVKPDPEIKGYDFTHGMPTHPDSRGTVISPKKFATDEAVRFVQETLCVLNDDMAAVLERFIREQVQPEIIDYNWDK